MKKSQIITKKTQITMKKIFLPLCFFIASISTSYAQQTARLDATTHAAFIPTGIVSGDTFRLIFVTETPYARPSTSTSAATLNTHAQNRAAASTVAGLSGFSSQFRALVSTTAVNAIDNTDTNTGDGDTDAAIYWLTGEKVADNYADFYDGSWDSRAGTNENGASYTTNTIQTGSTSAGILITNRGLDNLNVQRGSLIDGEGKEINRGNSTGATNTFVYALSPIFTVGASPNAPTDITLSGATNNAKSIAENTTEVGTFTTTDADVSDTHTYTLASGTGDEDNGKFTLDSATGVLSFTTAPDFETPTDAGDTAGDNTYAIRVETTDGTTPFAKAFIITVTDVVNDVAPTRPTIASFSLTAGNAYAKTETLTFTDANNGDTLTAVWFPSGASNCTMATYNAVTGAGNGTPITLTGDSSNNSVGRMGDITYFVPERDNPSAYNNNRYLCVGVTDGTNVVVQRSDNQFSGLQKNSRPTISFSPSSQDTSGKQTFDLTINVTDSNADQTVTAKYKVIDSSAACEATTTDTGATDITAAIGATNGKTVTLTFNSEDDNDKKVCVNAEDGSGIPSSGVDVTDGILATAAPTDSHTITGIDTTVPVLAIEIPDQTATERTDFSFPIPPGTFTDANTLTYTSTGQANGITFATDTWSGTGASLMEGTVTITVTATDAAGNSVTDEFTITIAAAPVSPNAPTDIALSGATNNAKSIAENTTEVGTFTTTDADGSDTHTYTLVSGTGDEDNGKFTLDLATGVLSFTAAPDFETPTDAGDTAGDNTYAIRVETTDGTTPFEKAFIITVTDVNEPTPPAIDDFSIPQTSGEYTKTITGITFTDMDDGDTLEAHWFPSGASNCNKNSYDAVVGGGNGAAIDLSAAANSAGRTGDILFFIPDHNTAAQWGNARYICVGVTDGTDVVIKRSTNSVGNGNLVKNSRPGIVFTPGSQDTSAKATFYLTINITDTASTQTITGKYKKIDSSDTCDATTTDTGATDITAGTGSATVTLTLNSEDDNDKKICVTAEDNSGIPSSETGGIASFATPMASPVITGIDTTVPVLAIEIPDQTATERTDFSFPIPPGTFTDANTLTYTSTGQANGITFATDTWSGTGASLMEGTVTITVTATDAAGNSVTDEFTITIAAAPVSPNAPTDITLSGATNNAKSIAENTTEVGTFTTTDADGSDTHAYTLASGTGDEDNGKFTLGLATGVLSFTTAPDFETPTDLGDTAGDNTYAIRVETTDGTTPFEKAFIITVTDVVIEAKAPTIATITLATNAAKSRDQEITVTDANNADTLTAHWGYVDASTDCSSAGFSTGGTELTLSGTSADNSAGRTATITYSGTGNNGKFLCVRASDAIETVYGVSDAAISNLVNTETATVDPTAHSTIIPSGLGFGDKFRLLFITSGALSGNSRRSVAEANTHVQNQANTSSIGSALTAFSSQFKALVSASGTDARDNTGTNTATATDFDSPIYWVNGEKVADDYTDFYDSNGWDSRAGKNQNGDDFISRTDTGSNTNGTLLAGAGINHFASAQGSLNEQADRVIYRRGTASNSNHRYYALSPVFVIDSQTNAEITGLEVSTGTLAPTFDKDVTAYILNVGTDSSITITPTVASNASFVIAGTAADDTTALTVTSDTQVSGLTDGYNTVTITTTSGDSNATETYTLTITRGINIWTGTTDSNWATATNWTDGVPTSTHNVFIPKTTNQPTAAAVTVNRVTMASGTSLIANSTFSGNITYNRNIDFVSGNSKGWYLMASPVAGETYDDTYVTANDIAQGSPNNRGIATYNTSTNSWEYFQGGGSGTFVSGKGYSIKKQTSTGAVAFTGTLNTDDVGVVLETTATNRFNLLGNPYPSYLNSTTFLNSETAISEEKTLWVWNQEISMYEAKNLVETLMIAPGQGFFVKANTGGGTFNFSKTNQSHTATDTFQKSAKTQVKLDITDGDNHKNYCKIYYSEETTSGFDVGYDGELFSGALNPFAIYTHLVSDSEGEHYQIQSLPYSDIENMVIPVGVNAASGKEISISADVTNFPAGVHLYLEDKLKNSFTQLDKNGAKYTISLSDDLEGIGRFFLRASSSDLNDFSMSLENISVYTSSKNNLRIVGIQDGDVKLRAYNILGVEIVNTSFKGNGKNDVAIPSLAAGIYIVHLEMETGKVSKKVVIE